MLENFRGCGVKGAEGRRQAQDQKQTKSKAGQKQRIPADLTDLLDLSDLTDLSELAETLRFFVRFPKIAGLYLCKRTTNRMKNDAELLFSYADTRSETDFAGFVGRRIAFVYHAALRQSGGDAQAAEDVTQAVFALAARRAGQLARHAQVSGWLYSTTTHLARRAWRDARLRTTREMEAARMNEIENENANANANGNENANLARAAGREPDALRPLLDEALGALREGERVAVLLRFFEGRGFAEIGVALKMSEDAARMRVTRAVEKMRAAFARRGVTSSAAALGALMCAEAAQAAPAGLAATVSAGAIATAGGASAAGAAGASASGAASAASAASASGAGAILAFMSSAKITTVAVVAILVAAGGVYYGARNERVSAASLAQARLENKNLAEQLRGLEKQEAVANGSAPAPKRTPFEAGQALLAEHPEIKEIILAVDKAKGTAKTLRMAKALNLTPEQSERLAEIWGRGFTIRTYKVSGYGDVRFETGNRSGTKDSRNEMRALMGDADYEKFRHLADLDYGGINQSRELATRMYLTDTPLTSEQAWSIDQISYDLSRNLSGDTDPEALWKTFQERAKSILSPEQMQALAEVGDKYIYSITLSTRTRQESEAKSKATKSK